MRNLLLILALFVGSSFAEEKSSWNFSEYTDVIDGDWSVVTGYDFKNRSLHFYDNGAVQIRNGDSYICADSYGDYDKLKVIFKIDDEEHFYQKFVLSESRSALIFKESYIRGGLEIERKDSTKGFSTKPKWGNSFTSGLDLKKFINKLKLSKELFIRTNDGCGKEVSMLFDLQGFDEAISNIYE